MKTKSRLHTKVWWPEIDEMVEEVCRKCHGCQVVGSLPNPEPMSRVYPPANAWQMLGADLLGPLPSGESLFVVVDYFSRYFEVEIMRTITTEKIVNVLDVMLSRFGVPVSLRTDNGPQFVSEVFDGYLNSMGIKHECSIPLWPQGNGEV